MTTTRERGRPARTRPGTDFADFPNFDRPETAPLLPFHLDDAVPADRVAACRIALKPDSRQAAKAAGSVDSHID